MRLVNALLLFTIFVLISSCTTEIKMARAFEKQPNKISILCEYPEMVFLTNSVPEMPEGLTQEEQSTFLDSAYIYSDYVKFINDTLFLRQFRTQMKEQFGYIGVNYYDIDDLDKFLASQGVQYIVSFKQLEIEERWEPYHAEESFGDMLYEEDFWIKGVSLNAWVDIAKVDDSLEIQQKIYIESVLKDEVDGIFFQNQWTGEVHYQYRLDTLELQDIGELEYTASEEFSYLIFSHIVNKEIRDTLEYLNEPEAVNQWILEPGHKRLSPVPIR